MPTSKVNKQEALQGLTKRELIASYKRFRKNNEYAQKIRKEYTDRFPNQWIAVVGKQQIIGPAADDESLMEMLKEKGLGPMNNGLDSISVVLVPLAPEYYTRPLLL